MRATFKVSMLKVAIISFAFAVCLGATAINAWQARATKAESQPAAAGGGSFMPTSTTALW
jgi:hypothetical protein